MIRSTDRENVTVSFISLWATGRWACSLPASTLFESSTIKQLSEKIESTGVSSPLIKMAKGRKPALFMVHPVSGQIFCYQSMAKLMDGQRAIYALELRFNNKVLSIEEMAGEYCDAIKKIQAEGPYFLAGWSIGGGNSV